MTSADEQIQRIVSETRLAEDRLRTLPVLQRARAEIKATATNRARTVGVTVDVDGVIQDLKVFDSALSGGGRRLAAEILTLIGEARRLAVAESLAVGEQILADDPEMLARMRSVVDRDGGV